jgi:cytochrome c oxidase assembly factor CtaG
VSAFVDVLGPVLLALLAFAYARRARTLAGRAKPVPVVKQVCFLSALVLLAITDLPPASNLAEDLVLAHMAQHLIIMDVAAVLFVLGLTGPILQPLLAVRWLAWLRALSNPLVALPLWALDLYLWHLSVLYEGVLDTPVLHLLQHACFLGFGIAMWMPLIGPLPRPSWFGFGAQLGYVIAVRLLGAVLANVLIWSNSPLYPDYAAGAASHGISPLTDQGIAGTIMMIESGLLTLGMLAFVFLRWAQQDTERQRLMDLADQQGVTLDDARAARAAAAGEGRRLEERLKVT